MQWTEPRWIPCATRRRRIRPWAVGDVAPTYSSSAHPFHSTIEGHDRAGRGHSPDGPWPIHRRPIDIPHPIRSVHGPCRCDARPFDTPVPNNTAQWTRRPHRVSVPTGRRRIRRCAVGDVAPTYSCSAYTFRSTIVGHDRAGRGHTRERPSSRRFLPFGKAPLDSGLRSRRTVPNPSPPDRHPAPGRTAQGAALS